MKNSKFDFVFELLPQDVFKLFIEQLKKLSDTSDALFQKYYYLLERLSVVRAFILLIDISEELVQELFQTMFDIVK